jgi:hypothetical protein
MIQIENIPVRIEEGRRLGDPVEEDRSRFGLSRRRFREDQALLDTHPHGGRLSTKNGLLPVALGQNIPIRKPSDFRFGKRLQPGIGDRLRPFRPGRRSLSVCGVFGWPTPHTAMITGKKTPAKRREVVEGSENRGNREPPILKPRSGPGPQSNSVARKGSSKQA